MQTIYKQSVPIKECRRFDLMMPERAQVVKVGIDPNNSNFLSVWYTAEVGRQANTKRYFSVTATGEPVISSATHLESLTADVHYVFHAWELSLLTKEDN